MNNTGTFNRREVICRHCGWTYRSRTLHPVKCPNQRCQRPYPLGEPTDNNGSSNGKQ